MVFVLNLSLRTSLREAPSEARRGALIILDRPDANGTLSVCRLSSVVVVGCLKPFWGGPLFWDTCGPDPRAICRQNMVPLPASEGSTFGTRNSRIRGGSSNQNVVLSPFVAI